MSKHAFTVVVAVIIAVSLLLYLFAFTVSSSQVGLVLRFGNPLSKPVEAGYHFKAPWPIDEVRLFDNRLFAEEGRFKESRTGDGFNVITSLLVGWRIDDVLKFNKNFGRYKPADCTKAAWTALQPIIQHSAEAVMGTRQLQDLVSINKEPQYAQIEDAIAAKASTEAMETFGMKVELVKIKRLELPESVANQVYQSMIAERNKEAGDIESAGKARASEVRSQAESQSKQILAMARSEAEKIKGEGDAKAKEYYQVFAKYPELEVYLRKLRAMRAMLKEKTTFVLDITMPPVDVFVQEVPTATRPENKN